MNFNESAGKTEDQFPFLCTDYANKRRFSGGLKGAFFGIIDEIRKDNQILEDAYCVWTGVNCTYDGMTAFLRDSAAEDDDHRWITGGLLNNHKYRSSDNSIPSATLYEDTFRMIRPPIEGYSSPAQAWNTIWKPFTPKGGSLFSVVFSFIYS